VRYLSLYKAVEINCEVCEHSWWPLTQLRQLLSETLVVFCFNGCTCFTVAIRGAYVLLDLHSNVNESYNYTLTWTANYTAAVYRNNFTTRDRTLRKCTYSRPHQRGMEWREGGESCITRSFIICTLRQV
jgi:hypothetical protein